MHHKQEVIAFVSDAVTNVALHPNQKGVDRAEGHFVTSAVMAVAGETSNAIELSSEGGTDSSAERQNQEPTDSMTRVLPCEMWYRDKPDQKEEEDDLKKPLGK